MEKFSKRLIMLRKENDLSQFGLGLELGVSRSKGFLHRKTKRKNAWHLPEETYSLLRSAILFVG